MLGYPSFSQVIVNHWPHILAFLFGYLILFLIKEAVYRTFWKREFFVKLKKKKLFGKSYTGEKAAQSKIDSDDVLGPGEMVQLDAYENPEDVEHIPFDIERFSENEMIKRSKEFYNFFNKRRTVRHFSKEPVPFEVIENIIRTAGTSPSGAHGQPWTFVVISNVELKIKVKEIVEAEEQMNYNYRMSTQWINDLKPIKTNWEKSYLETAPYLILVFKKVYNIGPDGEKKNLYYQEISACIASGILLMAIHNAGLVTLTSTPMNAGPALRTLVNRPVNEKLLLLLPVGYPSEDCKVPNFSRKPLEEILVHMP